MGLWREQFPILFNPDSASLLLRRDESGERFVIVYSPDDEAHSDGSSSSSPCFAADF
jgi:hypothetical protein